MLLTEKYLELKRIEAITVNNKIYYGNNIPNVFIGGQETERISSPSSTSTESATVKPPAYQETKKSRN